jgi:hypothetical protein
LQRLTAVNKETQLHIINILRQGTITWSGRKECLNRGRRQRVIGKKKDGEDKLLWERVCDGCGEWHLQKDNDLEVDHIDEVGPFKGCFDIFIRRMYCLQENLQALCFTCHTRKTSRWNSQRNYTRKHKDVLQEL